MTKQIYYNLSTCVHNETYIDLVSHPQRYEQGEPSDAPSTAKGLLIQTLLIPYLGQNDQCKRRIQEYKYKMHVEGQGWGHASQHQIEA
eukprot:12404624-Karenia_brevis.AAC.1